MALTYNILVMRRLYESFIVLALTSLLPSCGKLIKEDRDACPGILYFNLDEELDGEDRIDASVYLMPIQELAAKGSTTAWDVQQKDFSFSLRRADIWGGYALIGRKNCGEPDGSCLMVPEGSEWDALYLSNYSVSGRQEEVTVSLFFRKEYAALNLIFVDPEQYYLDSETFPFDVVVKGNSCGIDALSGVPVQGPFSCRPQEYTEGSFVCKIPRQADTALVMEIWGRDGIYLNSDLLARVPIGEMIVQQTGISWTEENLPDIVLEVQYAQNEFYVKVLDWEPQTHVLGQL